MKKPSSVDLHRFPIFQGLSAKNLEEVRRILHEKKIAAGEFITREGERGDALYLLLAGRVEVSKSLTLMTGRNDLNTRDKSLVVLRAEDAPYFGEMALLKEDSSRTAAVKTLEECTVGVIRRKDFIALCETDTGLGYRLLLNIARTLVGRLEKMNQDILKLTTAFSLALKN
ncbi:cyclic nucleotide-binding domain-containing protein [bacterium]|nr:cyclic nucleotide-binding domain-containing protein [bacterium]